MRQIITLAALVGALVGVPAQAGVFSNEMALADEMELVDFTCPIGGEVFRQSVTYPHLALETFSDGSHMGDMWVDTQVPLCPGNGLVLLPLSERDPDTGVPHYYTYTPEQLPVVETLIASPEYRALAGETRHLRAYWIGQRLGLPAKDLWEMLKVASWSADTPDQRRTALALFAADGPGLLPQVTDDPEQLFYGQVHVADALRQLGRFDEALALLPPLEPDGRDLREHQIFNADEPADLRLRTMIAERNTDRFAIALQPRRLAGLICNDPDSALFQPLTTARRDCRRREAAMQYRDEINERAYALADDEQALDASCQSTPPARRGDALEEACATLQNSRDADAGRAMFAADPLAVHAMCQDMEDLEAAGYYACSHHAQALSEARQWLLVSDEAAFQVACLDHPDLFVDPHSEDLTPCAAARSDKWNLEGARLWRDRANLGPACASLPDEHDYSPLDSVCMAIAEGSEYNGYYPDEIPPEPDDPGVQALLPLVRQDIAAASGS